MFRVNMVVSALALGLAATIPASAHMTKSHSSMMKRCHAMSHAAMMKNRHCASMMKTHHSAMKSHAAMKNGSMDHSMMSKDSMSSGMKNGTKMPDHR